MNIENFINLVREMRKAQLDYYSKRTYGILAQAKTLEKQVDRVLREGLDVEPTAKVEIQKSLFTEAGDEN